MVSYVLKRIGLGFLTILVISAVIFFTLHLIPGGEKWYAHLVNVPNQTPEQRQALIEHYGINRPVPLQYWGFLQDLLRPFYTWVDFSQGWPHFQWPQPPYLGYSNALHDDVGHAMWIRTGPTVILMVSAYILTLVIAIPVGIISAVKQYSKLDTAVTTGAFLGISLPNYWFGAMLIALLALPHNGHLPLFPVGDMHTGDDTSLGDLAWHLVLPTIVLSVQFIAAYARYIRGSMLDVLQQDYIRTARAKGLSTTRVVLKHAFRNSLLPLITLVGLDVPQLFGGAVITEFVFNWHGMGQLFVNQAESGDIATLVGILFILSTLVVIGNLVADIAYTKADPRISYSKAR